MEFDPPPDGRRATGAALLEKLYALSLGEAAAIDALERVGRRDSILPLALCLHKIGLGC